MADLPTFERLRSSGHVEAGALLVPVDPDIQVIAEVTEDGFIKVGEHLCHTLDQAAKEAHAEASSGWDFWQLVSENGDEDILLADLRARAAAAVETRSD